MKRCKNKPLRGLTIYGKSEQFKTTGANLFNVDSKQSGFVSGIKIGDKVEVSQNASYPKAVYFDEIVVDPTKKYSFCFWDGSTVLSNDNVRIRIYNDDNVVTEIPAKNNVVNKKFADGTTKVRVLILDEFPNLIGVFCEGSTLKAYEPYTGGQPSPSPDYPQEIKSVVEPEVKITGKNLYDFGKYIGEYTLNGSNIKASVSKDGTFTVRGTTETYASVAIGNFRVDFPNGDYYVSDSGKKNIIIQAIGEKGAEFRTGETDTHKFINGKRSDLYIVALQAGTFNVTFRPMICKEKEELSTSEPYHEQTVTLPYTLNAIPVSSGGNYTDENGQQWIADYVDMKRGKLVRNIEIVTFDGSDDENWLLTTNNNARMFITSRYFPFSEANIKYATYVIANMFESLNNAWPAQNINRIYIEGTGRLNIEAPGIKNVDALKALLRAENLICYAYREKSTEIPLTPDEITAYKALHTYTGITNISNDAEAWMQVVYDT